MKNNLLLSCVLGCLFLCGCAEQGHRELYKAKPAFYAYAIGDLKTERMVAVHASDAYITPASCQKTLTALLALEVLGEDFVWQTALSVSKKQGRIQDAVIGFVGDPTLTSEQLTILLKPLENTRLGGKLLLDASLLKLQAYSPNNMIDDMGSNYSQPISSMSVDKNLVQINVSAQNVVNDSGYPIETEIVDKNLAAIWGVGDKVIVQGRDNLGLAVEKLELSPLDIEPYMRFKIQRIMRKLNIVAALEIVKDTTKLPPDLEEVSVVRSEFLKDILPKALGNSDNFIFDHLYLKIVREHSEKPIKSWSDGSDIIKTLLENKYDIDMGSALFVDGSGLSRYNRIQPKQLWMILKKGYEVTAFKDALPYPGKKDTTVERRLGLPSHLKVKTGSMSGVNCLCGYSDTASPKIFVFVANSFAPSMRELYAVIDPFIAKKLR